MNTDQNSPQSQPVQDPIWRHCYTQLIQTGVEFNKEWPAEFFEERLRCQRDSNDYAFAMLAVRDKLERELGYYLQSERNGAVWRIPPAAEHEDIAHRFDGKMRRYAVRSINMRSATLMNPKAELSAEERARMEKSLEIASVRLCLIVRAKSAANVIRLHKPKLLDQTATSAEASE